MAVINPSTPPLEDEAGTTYRTTWVVSSGDTGKPVATPGAADKTIQVFGTDASVSIEGSLEKVPVNWVTLTDPQGNTLSMTDATMKTVMENVVWIRPNCSGGTSATVILLSRSTMR